MNKSFINHFSDEMWLLQLAYLADILCYLHEHNNSLHGFCTTFTSVYYKKEKERERERGGGRKRKKKKKRNSVPLLKKQKIHKCLFFHFWVVSPVNMKFN
jgi:hypothetical protein